MPGIVGFGKAIEIATSEMNNERGKIKEMDILTQIRNT